MDDTLITHRQKKRNSAQLKTQHRNSQNKYKRATTYSKDKGNMKQNRMLERHQKNNCDIDIEPRQYYCNICKIWNNTVECNGCYVEWCGVKGNYQACKFGQCDLCHYHISNFYNTNTYYESYYEYRDELYYQEYEDCISDIQWRGLLASVKVNV